MSKKVAKFRSRPADRGAWMAWSLLLAWPAICPATVVKPIPPNGPVPGAVYSPAPEPRPGPATPVVSDAPWPQDLTNCVPAPAGLVSWWRAEGDMTDAWDSNSGISGTASGMVYVTGRVGRAFTIGATYVQVADAPSLHFTNALTIEAWVYPTNPAVTGVRPIVSRFDASNILLQTNNSYFLGTSNLRPLLRLSPNGSALASRTLQATQTLPTNQWSYLVATYDGATMRLYINGALDAQTNYSLGVFPGSSDLGLGAIANTTNSSYWSGFLDEIALYRRALSAVEIQALYSADTAGKCLLPPTIIVQPQSQAIPLGEDVFFSATVFGAKPLAYQWRFNGVNLTGAIRSGLLYEKVQSNRIGNYSVFVTNAAGQVLSSNASLTLLPAPPCVEAPAGMISWWPADGTSTDVVGTNNAQVAFPPASPYATGKVDRAFNLTGDRLGSLISVPNSATLNFGSGADFSIEGWVKFGIFPPIGVPPWPDKLYSDLTIVEKAGVLRLPFPPFPTPGAGYSLSLYNGRLGCWLGAIQGPFTNSATFVSSGPDLRDGMFHHVALTLRRSSATGGNLFVDGQPVLNFNPTGVYGSLSNSAALQIGGRFTSGLPPTYFVGFIDELTLYSRALTAEEILAIRQAGAAGKCKVPPVIVSQPADQLAAENASATFTVSAVGTPNLRYQWRFNSSSIAGATGSSLTIAHVQATNVGLYSVRITNGFGAVTSSNASLALNQAPVAQCADVVVAADANCLGLGSVDHGSFDPDGDPITLTQSPPGPYPLGTNPVTLTVIDSHGLSNFCAAAVIVLDLVPPTLNLPANQVRSNDLNQCGAVVSFPVPTATDTCSPVTNITCTPPPGSFFPVGLTTVHCSATDAAGNTGNGSFTVNVRDTQPPTLTCPADITVTNAHDRWTSIVTFAPTAADNCPGLGEPVCTPPSGSEFDIGTHTVSCSIMDAAGNTSRGSFTITVWPGNQPPVPVIQVSPLAAFAGWTNLIVIAPDNAAARVVFDGSQSYDPDDTNFYYFWLEGDALFSTNATAARVLAVGSHEITLRLDDTYPLGTNSASVVVEVISPCAAVGLITDLLAQSELSPRARQPLLATLRAACASFERANVQAGVNQLHAFQNKVRSQVAPSEPALAQKLFTDARTIIEALGP